MDLPESNGTSPRKRYRVAAYVRVSPLPNELQTNLAPASSQNGSDEEDLGSAAAEFEDDDEYQNEDGDKVSDNEAELDDQDPDAFSDAADNDLDHDTSAADPDDNDDLPACRPRRATRSRRLRKRASTADSPDDNMEHVLVEDASLIGELDDYDDKPSHTSQVTRLRRAPKEKPPPNKVLHFRAVPDAVNNHASKPARRLYCFGPSVDDFSTVYRARRKWAFQPVLPSRTEDRNGFGGFRAPFRIDEEDCLKAAIGSWNWYFELGGLEAFTNKQVVSSLTVESAEEYLPSMTDHERLFLMGPLASQKMFKLPVRESISLADAWTDKTDGTPAKSKSGSYRSGFVLNAGARVHCLEWLPNQDGPSQYLAISVLPERESDHDPFDAPEAPAFTPQSPHKACIQLWKFTTEEGYPSQSLRPTLKMLLCSSWSDIKHFKWCPMSWHYSSTSSNDPVGLIAAIWADGGLRVIQVPSISDGDDVEAFHFDKAAIESHPPDTVFTCVTWISPSKVAAGCANGVVAIYDLQDALREKSDNARPKVFSAIAVGYILSITTGYPSHPEMLFTSCMDGYFRQTDMSQPSMSSPAATVQSHRTRGVSGKLVWHDYSKCAITGEDNYTVKAHLIRRVFNSFSVGRCKSVSTSMATGLCHPFVLIGTASGEVVSLNPMRKVIEPKTKIWQQTWFAHEWRRPSPRDSEDADLIRQQIAAHGLTRISEGYKVETVKLLHESASASSNDGVFMHTVYEKESAITALAWNPNIQVAGWAAAGMADGLVRVEDIAS